jgi:Alpha/beta hydrolase domain
LLVPQVDVDGNHIDGLRNTGVAAPLGTYTGWSVRKARFSEGDSCDLTGAFIPFFRTKAERMAAGDPRPSLEERYPTHESYVQKVIAAAAKLVADCFLLPQDADLIVSQAKAAAIP